MSESDYCVLILTHGRAGNQKTLHTLRCAGYEGEIILVVDDTDRELEQYRRIKGVTLEVFSLSEAKARGRNVGDNFGESHPIGAKGSVVWARNECWRIARKHGYRYFVELDDDYTAFELRTNAEGQYCTSRIKQKIGKVFEATFQVLKTTPVDCLAWSQAGDFIGGSQSRRAKMVKPWRKIMNVYFCDVERPFYFSARMNDDLTTAVVEGEKGRIFFTTPLLVCQQTQTQKGKGGLTDMYLAGGTYTKSMYSVVAHPAAVCVSEMGGRHKRLHHEVRWGRAVPKIVHERWRKSRSE